MGIAINKWKFTSGFPGYKAIKAKFREITGLHLSLLANLDLKTFSADRATIIEKLHSDAENYLREEDKYLKALHEPYRRKPFNGIQQIYLSCPGFYQLEVRTPSDNVLEIEYNLGQYYFPLSLNRVFYELGGTRLSRRGAIMEIQENELKIMKRLRPWKKYKWYNRPRK